MAETPPSAEELALRRRARRRLVGAVALALAAVVVLPMVFDPEPRPLGDKVDIRIPDQKTSFEPAPLPMPAPVEQAAPVEPAPVVEPVAKPEPAAKPEPVAKPEAKAPETKAAPKPTAKPETKVVAVKPEARKPEAKTEATPVAKPDAKAPEAKLDAKLPEAKPATGYYLQLGVFSSQANAGQLIAKAKAAGFKASSVQVGGQYKVRVGPVEARDKALDYQAKLKAKGLDNVLVEP